MNEKKKEFILNTFSITIMIILTKNLFDCSILELDLPCKVILLKEILAFISNFIELNNLLSLKIYSRY